MIAFKQVLKAGCECWMGQAKTKYFEINVLTLSSWCLTTERDSCWPNRARKASASDSLNLLESNLLFMGYLKDLRTNLYEAIVIDKWQLFYETIVRSLGLNLFTFTYGPFLVHVA